MRMAAITNNVSVWPSKYRLTTAKRGAGCCTAHELQLKVGGKCQTPDNLAPLMSAVTLALMLATVIWFVIELVGSWRGGLRSPLLAHVPIWQKCHVIGIMPQMFDNLGPGVLQVVLRWRHAIDEPSTYTSLLAAPCGNPTAISTLVSQRAAVTPRLSVPPFCTCCSRHRRYHPVLAGDQWCCGNNW